MLVHNYNNIISLENLLEAWKEFAAGKRTRKDVLQFERHLMTNIFTLHHELAARTYRHSPYKDFHISDPKPRHIHKASVGDRLVHHALYRILYPVLDRRFIFDSYSCRVTKGTHRAIDRFHTFARKASRNHTRTAWVLKCDVRKCFASIDHDILVSLLRRCIPDDDIVSLLSVIIASFETGPGVGLPLGNLTSQLLVNLYLNELDQFVKHQLKAKYYVRYSDDFAFVSHDRAWLEMLVPRIEAFLSAQLRLTLHPRKVSIGSYAAGIDFLGWVHFPDHRVLRTATKRRMLQRIHQRRGDDATLQSYLGLLSHGNTHSLIGRVRSISEPHSNDARPTGHIP